MRIQISAFISTLTKRTAALVVICIFLGVGSGTAHAIIINFDDLVYVPTYPEFDCFCDHPLTNEYLAKGLQIDDGFLATYGSFDRPDIVSQPNYLLGGNSLRLNFVGALPTSVGMYVSAFNQEAIFLNAFGTLGLISQKQTSGWAGPFNDTLYAPKQFISFDSPLGIASITLEGFFDLRVGAIIDDLTYDYVSVPEPSSFVLFGVGLLGFGLRKLRTRRLIC